MLWKKRLTLKESTESKSIKGGQPSPHINQIKMDNTNKLQELIDVLVEAQKKSVEPNTEAIDEAFFAGFCHALEYAKREIENADDIDVEIDEYAGDLTISGTINIELGQHLDADNMIDDIMRKYERDTTKDGSNV